MTPAPSIDAVSGLVAELRALSAYPGDAYDRAADALEVQARELAAKDAARVALCRDLNSATKRQVELEDRIAALGSDNREKDEALRPFASAFGAAREAHGRRYGKDEAIGLANFDKMPDRWPMDHLRFDMGTFRRARTALSNGEPHA